MTTTIKHYRNSFLDIESKDLRVFMDPWLNTANEGSWAATKDGNKFIIKTLKKKEVDFVYISHLHSDHFDKNFLIKLKKNQKKKFKFIIKKFKDNKLKNYLISCGFQKKYIIEVNEFEVLNLNKKTKFIILPQESSSNTSNNYIKYDLDTSCVYLDDNVRLYNQVDNPYSLFDISRIMKKLKKKINLKFNLAFIPYCAASEFPQSFINLNRFSEKKNIINSRIKKFIKITKKVNPEIVIPAGGSYKLDNIFSKLNKYLAIPKFQIIKKLFEENSSEEINIIDTHKHYFVAENFNIKLKNNFYSRCFQSKLSMNKNNLGYNKIKDKFSIEKIKKTLNSLEKNMPNFKKYLYKKTKTKIEFKIWYKQPVLIKNIKNKNSALVHKVQFGEKSKKTKLIIHIYYKLLLGIISKLVSWNEVQSHCLFERKPNNYDPDAVFWMNLYKY